MSAKFQMHPWEKWLVSDAFDIAWDFLKRSGQVTDEYAVKVFLCQQIMGLIDRGERHKIRLANVAIGAFEKQIMGRTDMTHRNVAT
jgi:hypothetical protein